MTSNTERRSRERSKARETLTRCRIYIGDDFYTLSTDQVMALLIEAGHARYRRPVFANGSRARYFHERLQRKAVQR